MHRTNRQAAQEPPKDPPWNGKGQGCQAQEGEISAYFYCVAVKTEGHGGYYYGRGRINGTGHSVDIWIGEYWHVLSDMIEGTTISASSDRMEPERMTNGYQKKKEKTSFRKGKGWMVERGDGEGI